MDIPKDKDFITIQEIQEYHTETLENHNKAIAGLINIASSLNEEAKIQTKYMEVNNKISSILEDRIKSLETSIKILFAVNIIAFVFIFILASSI